MFVTKNLGIEFVSYSKLSWP